METNFIGKNLEGILLGNSDDNFILKIDGVFYKYYLGGDCCSETYISDIIKNISLKEYPNAERYNSKVPKIVGYEELDLVEGEFIPCRASRQEEDSIYGIKLFLECEGDDPNSITIVYRNSSNGYYGGYHSIKIYDGELAYLIPEGYKSVIYDFHNPF